MRRRAAMPLIVMVACLVGCSTDKWIASACLSIDPTVEAEIATRLPPGSHAQQFAAVQSGTTAFEQVFFVSAVVANDAGQPTVGTWVTDSIGVVRTGPCGGAIDCTSPRLQPIILNVNDTTSDLTPSLRFHDTSEVPRPGEDDPAAAASRTCLSRAASGMSSMLTVDDSAAFARCASRGEATIAVPDVQGQRLGDAVRVVRSADLAVVGDGVPPGDPTGDDSIVQVQEPPPGALVPAGACIGFRTGR